jgi:thiosulfate/3-mercaptopyruvate sulfurtransferase
MFTTIISADALGSALENNCVVFDCRFSLTDVNAGRSAYNESHVLGAFYLHLDDDLSSPITPKSGRHPLPLLDGLVKRLELAGVSQNTQVVVYDDCGGAMAARAWWLIRCLGHKAVAVLDGGFPAWLAAKGIISPDSSATAAIADTVLLKEDLSRRLADHYLSVEGLQQALSDQSICLVDARGAERFRGEAEPIDPVAGHIPGALNRPLTDNLDNGFFKSPNCLQEEWLDMLNGEAAETVVHMCGSGVTACHNLLAMEIAGLKGSRIYAGSWSEWIRDASREVAKG